MVLFRLPHVIDSNHVGRLKNIVYAKQQTDKQTSSNTGEPRQTVSERELQMPESRAFVCVQLFSLLATEFISKQPCTKKQQ